MRNLLVVPLAALMVAGPVQAKGPKWMDGTAAGLPAGAKMAVVSGNPAKTGPFVIRAKFPANYTVPPHSHPGDETVRVVSAGALTYGIARCLEAESSHTRRLPHSRRSSHGVNAGVSAPTGVR